jgi:uncharacterized Tic20 family protein
MGMDGPSTTSIPTARDNSDRTLGMVAHLLGLAGFIIPFGNIIGPLILWQVKKDQSPFAADQAKESLNFQITVTIAYVIAFLLFFVVIGVFLLPLIGLVSLILIIIAAIQANSGAAYRYPFAWRLIS